jgi:rRNA maturation endonuclease Nob1
MKMRRKDMTETKRCEHCHMEINVKFKTCPFCGGEVHEPLEQELDPVCPR